MSLLLYRRVSCIKSMPPHKLLPLSICPAERTAVKPHEFRMCDVELPYRDASDQPYRTTAPGGFFTHGYPSFANL